MGNVLWVNMGFVYHSPKYSHIYIYTHTEAHTLYIYIYMYVYTYTYTVYKCISKLLFPAVNANNI